MEAAVVGAVVGAVVSNLVAKLSAVIGKRASELHDLAGDITSLKTELELIASTIDAEQKGQPSTSLQQISMTTMRDLAFEVEDCLDQFLPCAACGGGAVAILDVVEFAVQVRALNKRLEKAHKQIDDAYARQQAPGDGQSVGTQAVPTFVASDMVGIEKPKKEILGLLDSEKLMVISIVGFGGSGKTELALAVFDCDQVKENFGVRAWHVASEHKNGDELLLAIVKRLLSEETLSTAQMRSEVSSLQGRITALLQNTRCLIVIDDLEEKHDWEARNNFFSKLPLIRILLTTTVQRVAKACTGESDYIYNMRRLSDEDSKDLLKMRVGDFDANGSAAIVRKCHGHPLALISVANYLRKKRPITGRFCRDTSRLLCTHVDEDTNKDFTKLQQVLVNNYISLPAHLKTCLLYTSLFPNDRLVSRKTLTSRWLAEGYIEGETERTAQEAADKKFEELMDRNIIQPIDTSNRGEKKTFKPHGIMHQFMLYKSISSNFVATSLEKGRNFRHIIMENHTNRRVDHGTSPAEGRRNLLKRLAFSCFKPSTSTEETEYSDKYLRPRSLTVFGSAEKAVYSDLVNCELLKVLDLKECNNLKDKHIRKIYKLLHLKYLSLGSSVSDLPGGIKRLHCLETLDLRETKIKTLPAEVISLPHLVHLFGMIRLNKVGGENHKKSKLQTLSGVVVERNSQFPELMLHMEQLKKLKIWCKISGNDSNYAILSKAIQQFAQASTNTPEVTRSLSLHLNDPSKDLLRHLQGDNPDRPLVCCLSSLKVHGSLSHFHEFAMSLAGLEELCLTYTNLKGADLLAGLRELKFLVYLKLVEDHLEDLDINRVDDLPSLNRLCIVVKQSKFPKIAQGAMQNLVSLQLLCKDLVGLCDGIKVEHFKDLREVALDSGVHKKNTIEEWENEAKKHPKMLKVVLLKRVGPVSPVKYVATDHGSSEPLV